MEVEQLPGPDQEPAELPLVQGTQPDSREEWRYSVGLELAGWPFEFQVQIGRPGTAGSQRLDFLVATQPRRTPVSIEGARAHRRATESKDTINEARLRQEVGGAWAPLLRVNASRITSVQAAYAAVLLDFGRGPNA